MEKGELRTLFESEYPGKKAIFEKLIQPIFKKAKDTTLSNEIDITEGDKKQIKSFRIFSQVRGGFPIVFADVEVQDSVALKRSRVNIQNCVRKMMENDSNAIIFFHFSDDKSEWRVSFCHRADKLKESTNAKRFTYLCGTEHACRTIAERFETLKGLSTIKDEDLLEAFSVEPLSKEFFDEYREHYADLVEYISGKRFVKKGGKFVEEKTKNAAGAFREAFEGDDKKVRDFVKKMMGRLVFLQFLQKKGWLGVQENAEWGSGDKNFIYNLFRNASKDVQNDFLEKALEPLFFKSLNQKRDEKAIAPEELCDIYGSKIRIPYLNGGLFEEDELDKKKVKFKKEHFEQLLTFFNQYNFTIDETDGDDQEIGVDPEMLGKIFENLLEDNKDKGAFYTPKEIVEYMCRESLIAYLNEKLKIESGESKIRNFVLSHDSSQFNEGEKSTLLHSLLDVKICDPAVGSGAFPMGMMNELLSCTQVLTGNAKSRSDLKKHIVKNNIYGVDIEKGAVDIARLRFWLAIIVDEEEPLPLPNLDYKIMQGNSLLESFNGIDLSNLCRSDDAPNLFDDTDDVKALLGYLNSYFDKHEEKGAIRDAIKASVLDLLRNRHFSGKSFDALSELDLHENSEFFLWHTWFADVFNRPNDRNGFDIVIGNPPYVQLQGDGGKLAKIYENQKFAAFAKTGDIYCLFYEKGFNLLNTKGLLCFITSNKWMRAGYGEKLRDFFAKNVNPILLVDFAGVKVFDSATVDTNIMLFEKAKNSGKTKSCIATSLTKDGLSNLSDFVQHNSSACDFATSDSWVILSPIEQSIKRKIEAVGVPLKDWDISINYGIKTGFNDAFIVSGAKRDEILANCKNDEEREKTAELIRPILRGRDIKRYSYEYADLYLIATFPAKHYDIEKYPTVKDYLLSFGMERLEQTGKEHTINGEKIKARKKTNNKWFETQDSISYWDEFDKPKIVWARLMRLSKSDIDSFPRFCLAPEGFFVVDSLCFFTGDKADLLVKELNSEFATWYFFSNVAVLDNGGFQMRQQYIEEIPLPKIAENGLSIDEQIYKAFDFSKEEIDFIKSAIAKRKSEILQADISR